MSGVLTDKQKRKTVFSPFVLKLLFIMFLVEFVKGALIITFLPVYMEKFLGASGLVIGWTLAVQYIGDNALRAPIGWVIDKVGYRMVMVSGVVATLLSVGLISMTSSFGWMIFACALLGVGTAPLWPCVITGATAVAGDDAKGTVMSVVYIAWLCGVGLGPFVITYFMGGTYTSAFRLMLVMMAAVVVVALFLPGRHKHAARGGERAAKHRLVDTPTPRGDKIRAYFREVRRSVTVSWLMFPAMFLQTFALGLLTPVLTLYAINELQLTTGQFRMLLIAGGAVTVLCMIPVGKLVDKVGKKWFMNIGFALGSAVLLAFTYVHDLRMLYALVVLLGIAYALIIPSWNALIAEAIPPEKRGAVWGFFLTIEGFGTTVAPIVSGQLWDWFRPHGPFVASGVVLFVLLVVQSFISVKRKVVVS